MKALRDRLAAKVGHPRLAKLAKPGITPDTVGSDPKTSARKVKADRDAKRVKAAKDNRLASSAPDATAGSKKSGKKRSGIRASGAAAGPLADTARPAADRADAAAVNVAVAPAGVRVESAPSAVEATVDADAATVLISWTLPDDNVAEVGFRLHGATNLPCPDTYTSSGTCDLTEVPAGTYTVQYREDGGDWQDAGASAEVPVAPPTNVTLTPTVHGLTVDWDPSASPDVTGYVATATPVEPSSDSESDGCASLTGCAITDLSYQEYSVSVVAQIDDAQSEPATAQDTPLPEIPAAPTGVTATVSGPNAITLSWNAVTSDYGVPIKYMGGVGTTNWGLGCWDEPMDALTCTVDGLPAGTTYTITAYAIGDVMSDAGHAAANVTIPLPSSVPANAPSMDSNLGGEDPVAGGQITISGDGFQPFSTIVLAIYSAPRILGTATAGAGGAFSKTLTLPDAYLGSHTLVASGLDPSGEPRYMTLSVVIAAGGAGGLPVTGSPVALLLLIGSSLVTVGGGILFGCRPRRLRAVAMTH
jgi:hypothetical protein